MREDSARVSGEHPGDQMGEHLGEHLFGAQEAAVFLGIHRSTLHLAVARSVLVPDTHTPGGHLRFRRQTLERFADRLRCEPATSRSSLLQDLADTLSEREGNIAFCHRTFAHIRQAIPAFTMCAVALSTPTHSDPQAIEPLTQEGFPPHLSDQYQQMRPNLEFATTTALRTLEPELCDDIATKRQLRMGTSSLLRRRELRSFAIVPILVLERLLGVLVVASAKPHHIPPAEVSFLQSVAADLGVALSCHAHLSTLRSSLTVATELANCASRLHAETVARPRAAQRLIAGIGTLCDILCAGSRAAEVVVLGGALGALRHVQAPPQLVRIGQVGQVGQWPAVVATPAPGSGGPAEGDSRCTADVTPQLSPQLAELLLRTRQQGGPVPEREMWTQVDGVHTALALNLPVIGQECLTVGAAWHGERREPEADETLLLSFANACALALVTLASRPAPGVRPVLGEDASRTSDEMSETPGTLEEKPVGEKPVGENTL